MSKYERKAQSQRKHGPLSNSGASKAPAPLPNSRPDWKGPGYTRKQVSRTLPSSRPSPSTIQKQLLPFELQQLVLTVFRDTFPASNDFQTLKSMLREIKDASLEKALEKASGNEEYMWAYAVRWSPSRALGYANLLAWICGERGEEDWVRHLAGGVEESSTSPAKVVCFGGGAAEIMAFAALLRYVRPEASGRPNLPTPDEPQEILDALNFPPISEAIPTSTGILDLRLVDNLDWSSVISKLDTGLRTPPVLSNYASTIARAKNVSLLSSHVLNPTFTQANLFDSSVGDLCTMIGSSPALLTLLFTLNELYTASIPKTTAFLLKLTMAAPKHSLLLVVDTPGAYSETAMVQDGERVDEPKRFPMHWLMDHVLVGKTVVEGDEIGKKRMWEKVVDEDERLHRLVEGLNYPVSLENMRMQVHLFKRL